jgi:hypothetical protein
LWLFQQTTFYHQLEAQHLDASPPKMGLQAEYPICLIFAPLKGYDEPEILRSQLSLFGPISADAGQATAATATFVDPATVSARFTSTRRLA